jgi:hypothetical protein
VLYDVFEEVLLALLVGFGVFLFTKDEKNVIRVLAAAAVCIFVANSYHEAVGLLNRYVG